MNYLNKEIKKMTRTLLTFLLLFLSIVAYGKNVSIIDFGASQESINNATAIQATIDACAASGGGTVQIPSGNFLTSTIFLKSNVHLDLHAGAVLQGITDPKAYVGRAIIVGESVHNISISGEGRVDGQGNHANFQFGDDKGRRPHVVYFDKCTNVRIKDVFLYNSASWTLKLANCDGVQVNNIRIYSHGNHNCDGIDVNSKNVVISGCIIDCDDDGICFKTDAPGFDVEHVTVTNCIIASNCNGIKFGTGSFEKFKNISISNCVIRKASENNIRNWKKMLRGIISDTTVISGIALEVVDGGIMDQVTISNISMENVQTPLFIRLGNRRGIGVLKNVTISNIIANNESLITSSITGIPGHYVENVTIRDILFTCAGGAEKKDADFIVAEKINVYPENRMFGPVLPAYGLYVRHVKNLTIENIQCRLKSEDPRPAFIFDDVHNLWLNNFQVSTPSENNPIIRLIESSDVSISGFRKCENIPFFMDVRGLNTKNINVRINNLDNIQKKVSLEKKIKKSEIKGL